MSNQDKGYQATSISFEAFAVNEPIGKYDGKVTVKWLNGKSETFDSLADLQKSTGFEQIVKDAQEGRLFDIQFDVLFYSDVPNENNLRPQKGELRKAAKMAAGKPVLFNHNTQNANAEIGQVMKASHIQGDGMPESMVGRVSARDKEYQVAYLKGMRRRYSAGFSSYPDSMVCGLCGSTADISDYGYVRMSCGHYRGQRVKMEGGATKIVEHLFKVRDFIELSVTSNPAIKSAQALGASFHQEEKEDKMSEKPEQTVTDYSAQLQEKDRKISELESLLKKSNDLSFEIAIGALKSERLIVDKDDENSAKEIFEGIGIEKALAFYRKRAPKLQFSSESLGDSSKNEEPKAPEKKKEEAKFEAEKQYVLINGQKAYSPEEAARIQLGLPARKETK